MFEFNQVSLVRRKSASSIAIFFIALAGCSQGSSGGGFAVPQPSGNSQLANPGATPPPTSAPTSGAGDPPTVSPQTPSSGGTASQPAPSPLPRAPAPPLPAPRSSGSANLTVCAGANTETGADVSDYEPNTNWPNYALGGSRFVFIKATEGTTYTNPIFKSDWALSRASGVIRGAYHFFHPADDPTLQAQFYLKTVGAFAADDLGPMLDFEVTDNVSVSVQIEGALKWLSIVQAATGKTPIVYVDPSFFNALGNPREFAPYSLFIAEYGVSCPRIPPPWSNWAFWQKTDSQKIPGLSTSGGDYDIFNGSLSQLTHFANFGW